MITTGLTCPTPAVADCYDSGTVFDGRGNYSEGTLCRFGDDDSPVLPYYQKQKDSYLDTLFSEEEQMKMARGLVLRGRNGGEGILQQALTSSSRPLRPSRYRSMNGFMGGAW
jgi:hypothetical protein